MPSSSNLIDVYNPREVSFQEFFIHGLVKFKGNYCVKSSEELTAHIGLYSEKKEDCRFYWMKFGKIVKLKLI